MTIGIAILGAGGRMGHAIARCLLNESVPGLVLTGAVEHPDHPGQGKDVGLLAGSEAAGVCITADLPSVIAKTDVAIDFSFHEVTPAHARRVAEQGKALVIGTTGLSEDERRGVEQAAGTIPIVMAPNMSLGVNLLFSLAQQAAAALAGRGYDIEIIERHHRLKKDAPSGTALGLGEAVARGLGVELDAVAVHGRSGIPGERTDAEIGFHAVRGGDIVGDHTVLFAGDGESVELSHHASSRDTFASGALRAAAWVYGKNPGLYSMLDVLGINP